MYDQILRDILMEYEKKRDRAIYEQNIRIQRIYNKIPRIREIDRTIREMGLQISKAVIENPGNYIENMERVKKEKES